MRLDQWLWAVRVFKSRNMAADAIREGRVQVNAHESKPAHEVRAGEIVTVRFWERQRTLRVLGAPDSRVGAALVPLYAEDQTPQEPLAVPDDENGSDAGGSAVW